MDRSTEVILLALDFYAKTREGSPAAQEAKQEAKRIRDVK